MSVGAVTACINAHLHIESAGLAVPRDIGQRSADAPSELHVYACLPIDDRGRRVELDVPVTMEAFAGGGNVAGVAGVADAVADAVRRRIPALHGWTASQLAAVRRADEPRTLLCYTWRAWSPPIQTKGPTAMTEHKSATVSTGAACPR